MALQSIADTIGHIWELPEFKDRLEEHYGDDIDTGFPSANIRELRYGS